MEELKKLIDVLDRKGKSSATALLNYADPTNLETRLFQLTQTDTGIDETELIGKLYGRSAKLGAFRMLKSRVKRKLYNQLFFLDTENEKIIDKLASIEIRCRKLLYQAEVLRMMQEADLAEQILIKTVALASESQLVKYEIDALEQLRMHYAERKFDRRLFEECVSKLERLYEVYEIEKKVEAIYFEIRFDIKLGVEASHKFLGKLELLIKDLEEYWAGSKSSLVFRRYHQLKMIYYEVSGDFNAHILYLKDAFHIYSSGKIHPLYFSVPFNKYLLVFSYLRAKNYKDGLSEAEDLKAKLETGSVNWYAHLENYFLLAVHSQDYQLSGKLLVEALTNKYFDDNFTFAQEKWILYYEFLHYITGFTLSTKINRKLKHTFQDKKGFNVWSLILDFVLVLEKNQPDLLQREIDRVRKFISKYLVATEDARTRLFLKLLLVAGREPLDAKSCKRKGKYLFNKLQQTPTVGIAYAETEIVPFEHLWAIILHKMEGKQG
ncbi:hypothetical protein WG947_01895 [Pontibacter sp. H259]|uniref:hypothetical protein n=1 Tax=Pontibacter sp. H259 TaxID=3133421 RepID=UPI0030BDCDD6